LRCMPYPNPAVSINWRASLVPAAAVIPAPVAYTDVVAVKTLVVDGRVGVRCGRGPTCPKSGGAAHVVAPVGAGVGRFATCIVHSPLAFIHGNESLPFSGRPFTCWAARGQRSHATPVRRRSATRTFPLVLFWPRGFGAGSRYWGASMAITMNKTVCPKRLTCSDVWLSVAR